MITGLMIGQGGRAGELQENYACVYAELRSGDASAVAGGRAPVGQSVSKVGEERGDGRGRGVADLQRLFAEFGIA